MSEIKETIVNGKAVLGIEFGSTRIKAVLIGEDNTPIASGAHDWENRLEDGIWTYTLDDIWTGLQDSYTKMTEDVRKQYGVEVTSLAAIGFSAMMHGYMVFDQAGELLVPFRTWRNTITEQASEQLTELFQYHMEYRTSGPGGFKRRGACGEDRLSRYPCRLHTLAAYRRESTGSRRSIRYVPDRYCDRRLQPADGGTV